MLSVLVKSVKGFSESHRPRGHVNSELLASPAYSEKERNWFKPNRNTVNELFHQQFTYLSRRILLCEGYTMLALFIDVLPSCASTSGLRMLRRDQNLDRLVKIS